MLFHYENLLIDCNANSITGDKNKIKKHVSGPKQTAKVIKFSVLKGFWEQL
jgi:hypothetical protein